MQTLLPARCPIPEICRSSWHWKSESRISCQRRQDAKEEPAARIVTNPHEYGSSEFYIYKREVERKAQLTADASAAHVQEHPTYANEVILARNGERQLLTLGPNELIAIGLLTCKDIYMINQLLRSGGSLIGSVRKSTKWERYRSMQEFVDHALGSFGSLGESLHLDEPMLLFRGIGVPKEPSENNLDIGGIGNHLTRGVPWMNEFVDEGFSFATTNPDDALYYDGSGLPENHPKHQVLLQLDVQRGICVPHLKHRSQKLFEHLFDAPYLPKAIGQVVFPPGTRWSVVSIDRDSGYGVPLVRMKQVAN